MDTALNSLRPLFRVRQSWEHLHARIDRSSVNEYQKTIWHEVINYWKAKLGNGFFKNCSINHPLQNKLSSISPHNTELLQFTKAVQQIEIEDPKGFIILRKMLLSNEGCKREGIPFVELYRMYRPLGFQVSFPKPDSLSKCVDILLVNKETGEDIYIEVSQLGFSDKQTEIQEQHHAISNAFLRGYQYLNASRQLRLLTAVELREVCDEIVEMKKSIAAGAGFLHVEDDRIKMALSDEQHISEIDEWCKINELRRGGVDGLSQNFNDISRLSWNKIKDKLDQLPPDKSGIIIVPVSCLFFFVMDRAETIVSILNRLMPSSNCLGVLLISDSVGSMIADQRTEVLETVFRVKTTNGLTRHMLFVKNLGFDLPLSPQTRGMLCRIFQ